MITRPVGLGIVVNMRPYWETFGSFCGRYGHLPPRSCEESTVSPQEENIGGSVKWVGVRSLVVMWWMVNIRGMIRLSCGDDVIMGML